MIILNNTFLISFEVNLNGNSTRVQGEHWAVPVPFESDLINSTYRCFIDPLNTQQQPLIEIPDIASIRHDFICLDRPLIASISKITTHLSITECTETNAQA
ncbi:unnamed protein product [Adineta steineri]|uniref:Uncharacterized protein n=1 Tax=Adineta steineri TaxID=433720 RepID=A0A813ZJZ0_9BILA|nr:unnamed protein product [Adineta steineri]CAF3829332.1 unnamed protein product [Adineta steineri]